MGHEIVQRFIGKDKTSYLIICLTILIALMILGCVKRTTCTGTNEECEIFYDTQDCMYDNGASADIYDANFPKSITVLPEGIPPCGIDDFGACARIDYTSLEERAKGEPNFYIHIELRPNAYNSCVLKHEYTHLFNRYTIGNFDSNHDDYFFSNSQLCIDNEPCYELSK